MNALADRGAALLGGTLDKAHPIGGGDLSDLVQIVLEDGREAIIKGGPAPRTEAEMLRAIAASGAPAPAVLAADDDTLVLERLDNSGGLGAAWRSLGEALATLHSTTGDRYGWHENCAFGHVPILNEESDDWARFWAERRLAMHAPELPADLARAIERLAADCPNRLPARPSPALLHGDLWGGNVLVSGNTVSGLIDPACYYGHVEVDLAMLNLFDRPGAAFHEAYGPLEPGHEDRLPIYTLWPALVHLRLFGRGYRPLVERLLRSAGISY